MSIDSTYDARFSGIGRLYGIKALERIKTAHILVVGIGGVGSWVAESLARSGIGGLTLVDLDDVCVTNVNRQVHALSSTVGKFKVEVMKERLLEVQPYCDIDVKQCFFSPKNIDKIFDKHYDFVVDACDDFTNKCHLIDHCRKNKIPVIVMGGAGGKVDPLQVKVSDMSFSQNDRLLARLRKNFARISIFRERMMGTSVCGPSGLTKERFIRRRMDVPLTGHRGLRRIWIATRASAPRVL